MASESGHFPSVTLFLDEKCLEGSKRLFLSAQCRSASCCSIIFGPPAPAVLSMNNPLRDLKNSQCVFVSGGFGGVLTSPVLLVAVTGTKQPHLYLPFKSPGIRRMLAKVESSEFECRKVRKNA